MTRNFQTTPISTCCVAFRIFVGQHRDIKFGVQVNHSKSKSTRGRQIVPERGVVTSRDEF